MTVKKSVLFSLLIILSTSLSAQIEVAHLMTKGHSANGFGGYLNFGVNISDAGAITAEAGLYYFSKNDYHLAYAPVLLGYRHTLDGSGYGFYIEPAAGYTFGGTDIAKVDANGNQIYENGSEVDQKNTGITGAMTLGYLFQFPLSVGVRYTHVFVSGDPSASIVSLRLAYTMSFGRRQEY